ncbi:hypothetical protein COU80_03785 [Candidatus Peregrinibacteria bacterium CG10_big_fil_rev_8_21_14_0_10_55_24]|nr:MAG: hypothetical protein COU80_03785 [Candidatus Peregrinibacteria bacterium CG10_big_fil_rev_8_21_14_0_10_55_24]
MSIEAADQCCAVAEVEAGTGVLEKVQAALVVQVGKWTAYSVRLACEGDMVVLSGRCESWYQKKLLQDTAMSVVQGNVRNDVDVR